MGHALNGSMQDALVRMNRMRGRNTLWILGTDHAGIATQARGRESARAPRASSRQELGREAFVERVWEWRERVRRRRSSSSTSGSAPPATTSASASRSTTATSAPSTGSSIELYDKGYIYRDNYMVNWDPGSRSAISDLEVEDREVEDTLYSIDYPLEGSDAGADRRHGAPGDDAGRHRGRREPRRRALRATWSARLRSCRWSAARLPIIADDYVDPEFGTGALKITPGHDPNDFEIGRRHGLEEIGVIGEDGRMTEEARRALRRPDRRRGAGGGGRGAARARALLARRGALHRTRSRSRTAPASGSSR